MPESTEDNSVTTSEDVGDVAPPTDEAPSDTGAAPTEHTISASGNTKGLKQSVFAALPGLFAQWEGKALPYMYTDSKGLVTIGTGNLFDPISHALGYKQYFVNADGSPASEADITDAWHKVKDAYPGVQSTASAKLTTVRMNKVGLDKLITDTISGYLSYLRGHYPQFDMWPADAQMAVLSISWAWGPGFSHVWGTQGQAFDAAINKNDFVTAGSVMLAASKHEEGINPGIVPRDKANVAMFQNAANVVASGSGYNTFFYPKVAPSSSAGSILRGAATFAVLLIAGFFIWRRFS